MNITTVRNLYIQGWRKWKWISDRGWKLCWWNRFRLRFPLPIQVQKHPPSYTLNVYMPLCKNSLSPPLSIYINKYTFLIFKLVSNPKDMYVTILSNVWTNLFIQKENKFSNIFFIKSWMFLMVSLDCKLNNVFLIKFDAYFHNIGRDRLLTRKPLNYQRKRSNFLKTY